MNTYEQIGAHIAAVREKKGMTQNDLAAHLGISPQCLSGWERGTRRVNLSDLCRMADLFNVTFDSLIRGVQSHNVDAHRLTGFSDETLEIIRKWKDNPFAKELLEMQIKNTSKLLDSIFSQDPIFRKPSRENAKKEC